MNKSTVKKIKNEDNTVITVTIPNNFKLYRMRTNNEFCVSAFMMDEIWGTKPEAFNDPYDTVSIYNIKKLYDYAATALNNNSNILKVLCSLNNIEVNEKSHTILGKMIVDNLNLKNNMQNQKVSVVSCFTEKIDNEIMWSHYANNAKGFALEYDYNELLNFGTTVEKDASEFIMNNFNFFEIESNDYKMPSTLIPVFYDNSKYDMTDYLKKVIDNEINNIKIVHIDKQELTLGKSMVNLINSTSEFWKEKTAFWKTNAYKKKDWKYEREWRLLSYNLNPFFLNMSPHYMIGNLVPTAIYLGERISQYDKIALIEIAKTKKIKIYQMYSKISGKTMKLAYKEIKY